MKLYNNSETLKRLIKKLFQIQACLTSLKLPVILQSQIKSIHLFWNKKQILLYICFTYHYIITGF